MAAYTFSLRSFAGTPSPFSTSHIVLNTSGNCCVIYSASGAQAAKIAATWKEKISESKVESAAEFVLMMQRLLEQSQFAEIEVAAVWQGDQKIVLFAKQAEIYLEREEKVGRVLQAGIESQVVEGKLSDKDEYVLLTRSASVEAITAQAAPQQLDDFYAQLEKKLPGSQLVDRCAIAHLTLQVVPSIVVPSTQLTTVDLPEEVPGQSHEPRPLLKQASSRSLRTIRIPRKWLLVVGAMVALLIILIVFIRTQVQRQRAEASAFLAPYEQELLRIQDQANEQPSFVVKEELEALIRTVEGERQRVSQHKIVQQEITNFIGLIDSELQQFSGKTELQRLPVFFDLQAIRAGFVASVVAAEGDRVIMLDQGTQTFVSFNLSNKTHQLLPVGQYSSIRDIVMQDQQLYILSDGVYLFSIEKDQESTKVIEEGDSNRNSQLLGAFSQYVYIFNPEKRNIFRYLIDEGLTASQPVGWMIDKKDVDFEKIVSMQVDGQIWLGTADGRIFRFEQGNQVPFTISGLNKPFQSPLKIVSEENSPHVFLLEANQQRLVVLTKEGQFVQEIVSPSLAAAVHLIVREDISKVFAVAGSLVYELDL